MPGGSLSVSWFPSRLCCPTAPRTTTPPGHVRGGRSPSPTRQAQGRTIEDQIARQLDETSRDVLSAVGSAIPDEVLKSAAANLRNLRSHMRDDMQRIVDESNKSDLEAVATVEPHQSVERTLLQVAQKAEKILQVVTKLGTDQSMLGRRLGGELARLTVRIPSHAILLPPRDDENLELTDAERQASSWIQRLKDWHTQGKRGGKGLASKEYRLFFLCGHDNSLAECGFGGKGYEISCPRTWTKKVLPLAKALLVVVNVALKTFVGLSIPADGVASVGGKALGEILSSVVEVGAETSLGAATSMAGERLDELSATADSVKQAGLADGRHGVGDPFTNVSQHLARVAHSVVI